jgi:hypothetical protein
MRRFRGCPDWPSAEWHGIVFSLTHRSIPIQRKRRRLGWKMENPRSSCRRLNGAPGFRGMLARATRHPAVCWSVIPPLYLRLEKVRAISLPAPVEEPRLAMEDDLMILDELKFDRIGHI